MNKMTWSPQFWVNFFLSIYMYLSIVEIETKCNKEPILIESPPEIK